MTKAKKTTVEVLPPEDRDEELDVSPEESDILTALGELEGAAEAKWKVHRVAPLLDGKSAGYCDTFTSAELTMELLRDRFGRGTYRLIGHDSKGRYIKTATVPIATDPPKKDAAPAQSNSDVLTLLAKMSADQTERDEKRAERSRDLMTLIIPAAITALPGIFQALRPAQSDPVAMLAALQTLRPEQPKAPDMMPLITKLIEVASGDKGTGETNWMDLAKGVIEQLPGVLSQMKQAPAPQLQTLPTIAPPPAQAVETANGELIQSEGQDVNALKMLTLANWARATLKDLVKKAAASKDPDLYADYVYDNPPDGVDIREFVKYLYVDNWWEVLQQFEPSVAPYHGWFSQFRTYLIDTVEQAFGEPEEGESSGELLKDGE